MAQTVEIVRVNEPKPDKNGNMMMLCYSAEYQDNDGVFHMSQSLFFYNPDLFDKIKVGSKVAI